MKHNILIVDDHSMVREGLAALVNTDPHLRVVGLTGNVVEAKEFLAAQSVDLAVIDFNLPDQSGIELLRHLTKSHSDCIGILLTMHKNPGIRRQALAAGAADVLLKDNASDALIATISQCLGLAGASRKLPILSRREQQVLTALTDGMTSKELAEHLGLGQKTIETYRERLHAKFGSTNTSQLIHHATRYAVRHPGRISPTSDQR